MLRGHCCVASWAPGRQATLAKDVGGALRKIEPGGMRFARTHESDERFVEMYHDIPSGKLT